MLTKSCPVKVKAGVEDGLQDGQFEAIVSVFGNKDWYGDVVVPGAFTDTLATWKASGDPIPVVWSHMYQDPDMHVGVVLEAEERAEGLWVKGLLDIDDDALKAKQVYRLLKGRRVTQFSFSYDVEESGWAKQNGEEIYELRKVKLYEVGPTLIGANQETELLGVKSAAAAVQRAAEAAKEGRVLSAKNEAVLRETRDQLTTAVASLDQVLSAVTSEDGKAKASEPAKDEEPDGAKSEEPMRSPASVRLSCDVALAVSE